MDDNDESLTQEALIEAVQNQIRDGDPKETGLAYKRLTSDGYLPEEAMRLIALVLEDEIDTMLRTDRPFGKESYIASLMKLPDIADR